MKDKLLYLTIGLLIGIVVMQWTMPNGRASIVQPPAGAIVAADEDWVLTYNGELWRYDFGYPQRWLKEGEVPLPVDQIQFIHTTWGPKAMVDKNGNWWRCEGGGTYWVNYGQPPVAPVPTASQTWGGVKGKYDKRE